MKQGSKNVSIKMLKDVGMTVPKCRETSAVGSKTGYAAREGMRAYTGAVEANLISPVRVD